MGINFAVTEALICLVFYNITSITLCLFVPHFKALFFCRNTHLVMPLCHCPVTGMQNVSLKSFKIYVRPLFVNNCRFVMIGCVTFHVSHL